MPRVARVEVRGEKEKRKGVKRKGKRKIEEGER
jgi:hypothetical protein